MDYFAGLDVSVKETSVCIVDDTQYHGISDAANLDTWKGMSYQTVLTPADEKTGNVIYPYAKAKHHSLVADHHGDSAWRDLVTADEPAPGRRPQVPVCPISIHTASGKDACSAGREALPHSGTIQSLEPEPRPRKGAYDVLPPQRQCASNRRGAIVLGWSGMRGLITLATAFALPQQFPGRDLIVLCAFCGVLGTLVIQGFTPRARKRCSAARWAAIARIELWRGGH